MIIYCAGKHKHVGWTFKVNCFCRIPGSSKGRRWGSIASSKSGSHFNKFKLHLKLDLDLHIELKFKFSRGTYMCWPANSHCVPLKSSVLFNTEYLAIFNFPDLLYFLMLVPVVCMLFQQLYKSCVLNGNPPSFTHCIFSPLRDFVDSRFNHLKRNLSLS